jgi:hypothetical protein
MDNFLDSYDNVKLKQENLNHLNISIACNEIEAAIKSLPQKESAGSDGCSTEFYQSFKED